MDMFNLEREQALHYFGKRSFRRLFSLFKDKIESLNAVGGTVKFVPTEEERVAIENWLGEKFTEQTVSVSLIKFEKRLRGSKYEDLFLWELVEWVTQAPIVSKKERILTEEESRLNYFTRLLERFPHPNAQLLVQKFMAKESGTGSFIMSYNAGEYTSIEYALKAVSEFPQEGTFERLPVFAERIAGDPHYFDKNKKLYHAIELLISEKDGRTYRSSLNAEDEANLLAMVGLAKDDLHSFVTCFGLEAYCDNRLLQQWHWANQDGIVQNIPLRSLQNIDSIKPVRGNKVFIVENSGVYSSILDKLDGIYPVVCTHGNFKLSGLLLLDKLVKGGAELYYSGDIDINGILLAKYLKKKYGDKIRFWRMGIEEYRRSISQVPLSTLALKKLDSNEDAELKEVIQEMNVIKKAGYQEPLLDLYIYDMKNL